MGNNERSWFKVSYVTSSTSTTAYKLTTITENHWYFHFALPVTDPVAPGAYTDSMYYVHPHSSEPESAGQRVPFPVDPATGSTHLCMGDADAYTLSGDFFSMGSPTEAITQNYAHLILCGEKTGGLWDQSRQYFDFKPKPTNHRLDDMELNALTLYHEFAHLAIDNEITPDATVWTRAKDARGNWHPRSVLLSHLPTPTQ